LPRCSALCTQERPSCPKPLRPWKLPEDPNCPFMPIPRRISSILGLHKMAWPASVLWVRPEMWCWAVSSVGASMYPPWPKGSMCWWYGIFPASGAASSIRGVESDIGDLPWREGLLIPKAEEYLGRGHHIEFTIRHDPADVPLPIKDLPDPTAVHILLGGGYAQNMRQELQGGEVPIIPEFPEFHGVQMGDLPGFFAE